MAWGKPYRILIPGLTGIGIRLMAALTLVAWPWETSADSRANVVAPPNVYLETKLLSDIAGFAPFRDPDLKNPWGLAFFPGNPFWIADNKERGLLWTFFDSL